MSRLTGRVAGATAMERAVRIAGALAELGVQRVSLDAKGSRVELKARDVDLPALLVDSGEAWQLECTELRVNAETGRANWHARDQEIADAASRSLG